MLKIKFFIGSLAIVAFLSSCKKDEHYDIQGDSTVKFFTNNESAGNAPQNSITYNVVNIPNTAAAGLVNLSTTMPASIKFPVFATKPVSSDVTISAEIDNSLVTAYNQANVAKGVNYVAFPAGFLNASGLSAHIQKGGTASVDSITVTPNLAMLNSLTDTTYMTAIRLTNVSDPNVGKISDNNTIQVTYLVARVEQRRIRFSAIATEALGALITNRAPWTVIYNPAPTLTGSIFDGSTATYNRWVASPVQLDVNLQNTQNVTGIRLHTSTSATYVPTQVNVYLSMDGITYDLIGSPLKANLTYASAYNYILFYKAIPAKYIRVVLSYVTNTNTQNYRVTEFDVYAN